MIEPEMLEAIGKIAGVIAVAVFTGWSKIESGRAKKEAKDAKQQAAQTDKDVNVIDLSQADRARTVTKFMDIERRLKQLEEALTVLLSAPFPK